MSAVAKLESLDVVQPRSKWFWLALGAIGVVLAIHAWVYFFLCDDAYIVFRYARNFARGQGLVFNVGERVEGYTCFLWTLQLALAEWVGISSESAAPALLAAYTAAAMILWARFVGERSLPFRPAAVLLTLLTMATNRTWAVWSSSGLETRSFTFFVLAMFFFAGRVERGCLRAADLAGASLMGAFATLSRPDAQAFFPLVAAFCFWHSKRRLADTLAISLPFTAIVGGHYLWRYSYYGAWLPNTYYAKVEQAWPEMGWRYLAAFCLEYGLYLVLPLVVMMWRRVTSPASRALMLLSAMCMSVQAAYYGYVVGGDHFEFRIFDFFVPLLSWMSAEALLVIASWHRVLAAAAALLLFVYSNAVPTWSAYRAKAFNAADLMFRREKVYTVTPEVVPSVFRWLPGMRFVVSIHGQLILDLTAHAVATRQELHRWVWEQYLRQWGPARGAFASEGIPPMLVAHPNVGVAGYYLDVPLVDTLGLTDGFVAREPSCPPAKGSRGLMAHNRIVPGYYLVRRRASVRILSVTARPLPQGEVDYFMWAAGRAARRYSMRIRDSLWLNISTWDEEWLRQYFTVTPTEIVPHPACFDRWLATRW
jgi:arabinofuranosyltransferase